MHTGRTIFAQLMDFLPLPEFRACVARYQGEYKVRGFSCLDQFLCLAFAQLTYRESLRDIETCLRAMQPKLYHMGIRGRVARSTLADANETRDWRIYADFAQILIGDRQAALCRRALRGRPGGDGLRLRLDDDRPLPGALPVGPLPPAQGGDQAPHAARPAREHPRGRRHLRRQASHDVKALDVLVLDPGAFYVLDRGYLDFGRLFRFHQAVAFFVTRAKANLQYRPARTRIRSTRPPGSAATRPSCSRGPRPPRSTRCPLRRIRYIDPDTGKRLVFLTNDFTLPALTIAQLYKARWQVELFFKWIKQHLRIKAFYGTSANAVKTQVWIAISVYVLVAILKKRLGLPQSLYTILQVLSVTLFETNAHLSSPRASRPTRLPRTRGVTSCHCSIDNRTLLALNRDSATPSLSLASARRS